MGRPKAELRVGGRPILEYLLERIQWPGPTLLVTAPGREHPPGWEQFGREMVDTVAGEGPLRGIATALEAAEPSTIVVVTTCDMPGVTSEQFHWLADAIASRPLAQGVLLRRADDIEPFPTAFRAASLPSLREQLARGRRAVHALALLDGFVLIDAPSEWTDEVWINLNEPADFDRFIGQSH